MPGLRGSAAPDGAPKVAGYVLEELIGWGSSAQVWRARATRTGEPVAIKRIAVPSPAQRRAAQAEAALLAGLDHPHLVHLHELVVVDDAIALVLDLAPGGSLADLLARRGRLGVGEVVTAIAPVAAALAYAHDEAVVHCDVSAANVLFTAEGRPLLADLGVARLVGDGESVHATPEYVDPAVAAGAAPGPPSDVFALAAVALHALTGTPAWTGPDAQAVLTRAAGGTVPDLEQRLSAVPGAVADVLRAALSGEPHRRPTAAEFALDLRHSASPVPIELTAGAVPPPAPPAGRHALPESSGPAPVDKTSAPDASWERPAWRRDDAAPDEQDGTGAAGARSLPTRQVHAALRREAVTARAGRGAGRLPGRGWFPGGGWRRFAAALAIGLILLGGGLAGARWWTGRSAVRAGDVRPSSAAALTGADAGPPTSTAPRAPSSPSPSSPRPSSPSPTSDGPTSAPTSSPASASTTAGRPDVLAVLGSLDRARAAAFAARNPAGLSAVYLPGRLLDDDAAALLRVVPAGCGLVGLRTTYRDVAASALPEGRWRVRGTASVSAATLRCGQATAGRTTATSRVSMTLVVAPAGPGWRIASITAT